MGEFKSLCTVLKRCKLSGIVSLVPGPAGQVEIRNKRAMEIIRGMIKQKENTLLVSSMRIEWEFLKAREKYLKTGKIKKSLLNRAVYLAKNSSENTSFTEFIEDRAKSFISYGEKKDDKEPVRSMNKIVKTLPEKSLRKILYTEIEAQEEYPYTFQGVTLLFHDKEIKEDFLNENYKRVIGKMKNSSDFDSQIVVSISRIEQFKLGMNKLLDNNDKRSKKTLDRYMRQWPGLYTQTLDLFSANFMDEEYLHRFNKEVSYRFAPVHNSVLFHPVTYDMASVYIHMPQEPSPSPAGITGMLSRMNLFRR